MNNFIGYTVSEPYNTESSNCGSSYTIPCNKDKPWAYGIKNCGAAQHQLYCSALNPNSCPIINNVKGISQFDESLDKVKGMVRISCTYDPSTIQNYCDLKEWMNQFSSNNCSDMILMNKNKESFEKQLLPNYCFQSAIPKNNQCNLENKSNICPTNPITNEKMQDCTKFNSDTYSGNICKNWMNNQTNKYLDNKMIEICQNKDLADDDCACINADKDPTFNQVINLANKYNYNNIIQNPGCWWYACNTDGYLIPSNVKNSNCAGVCQNLTKLLQTESIMDPTKIKGCGSLGQSSNTVLVPVVPVTTQTSYFYLYILAFLFIIGMLFIAVYFSK